MEARDDAPYCLLAEGLAGAGDYGGPAAVLVQDGRIAALGREALEAGAPVRELPGLWLAPAPLDAHVHLYLGGAPAENLERSRRAGLAAVRDLGHPPARDGLEGLGFSAPPLLVYSGPGLGCPGPGGCWLAQGLEGAAQFADQVRRRSRTGASAAKVFASGLLDFDRPGQVLHPLAVGREETAAVVKAARREGLKTVVHASGRETVMAVVEAGADSVEHGFFLGRPELEEMAARGVTWSPTLAAVLAHVQDAEQRHAPERRREIGRIADMQARSMRLGEEIGVNLVLGTDAGSYGLHHGEAVFLEMRAWLQAGLSPGTVLAAATSRAAEAMGLGGEVGEIALGARAWLLACSRDPALDPLALKNPVWRSF